MYCRSQHKCTDCDIVIVKHRSTLNLRRRESLSSLLSWSFFWRSWSSLFRSCWTRSRLFLSSWNQDKHNLQHLISLSEWSDHASTFTCASTRSLLNWSKILSSSSMKLWSSASAFLFSVSASAFSRSSLDLSVSADSMRSCQHHQY